MGPLKTKMLNEMRLRNFSEKTVKAYLCYIQDLANHHRRSPALLSTEDVKDYLLHMINERKAAASTVNLAYSSFKFFYTRVVDRGDVIEAVPRPRKGKTKPVVLGVSEVRGILDVTTNIKHKTILMTIYSSGLRVGEVVNLRVSDIDSERMQMFIRCAKGRRDRYVMLSRTNLEMLRTYYKIYRPDEWMFYSAEGRHKQYSIRSVEKVFKSAAKKAGIAKNVTVHSLRHSFATHMLENGIDLHHIQLLMGHASPKTTSVYLHVQKKDLLKIKSPLDAMAADGREKQTSESSPADRGGGRVSHVRR